MWLPAYSAQSASHQKEAHVEDELLLDLDPVPSIDKSNS